MEIEKEKLKPGKKTFEKGRKQQTSHSPSELVGSPLMVMCLQSFVPVEASCAGVWMQCCRTHRWQIKYDLPIGDWKYLHGEPLVITFCF